MKKTMYKFSAAVASLALAGTCFAAPAMADTTGTSLFGSLSDGAADQAAVAAVESDVVFVEDNADGAGVDAILSDLGLDSTDLEAMLSGDFSRVAEAIDLDGIKAEFRTYEAQVEQAFQSLLDNVLTIVAEKVDGFIANHTAISDPLDFSTLTDLGVTGETISADGVSFLLPEGFTVETIDLVELVKESPELAEYTELLEQLDQSAVVTLAVSDNGLVAVSVNSGSIDQLSELDVDAQASVSDFMAQTDEVVTFALGGYELSGGKAILSDGTEAFLCTYSNGSAAGSDSLYVVMAVVVPTSDTTFTTVTIAYTGEVSYDDTMAAAAVLGSLVLAD